MRTDHEPPFAFFSHARRALGALSLAALGALVMIGLIPLLAGRSSNPADQAPSARKADQPRPLPGPELAR